MNETNVVVSVKKLKLIYIFGHNVIATKVCNDIVAKNMDPNTFLYPFFYLKMFKSINPLNSPDLNFYPNPLPTLVS